MATKTEKKVNTPTAVNKEDLTPSSNITYNNEVVAIIAGLAANEVEGIAGMCNVSTSLKSKNRNITKGVKVEVGTEEVAVDLYVIVEYGIPIQRAAADAQENVRKAIESMTGLHVVRVDVHVQSVSFEQEKKALQAGVEKAALSAGEVEADQEKLTSATETKPNAQAAKGQSAKEPAKAKKEDAAHAEEKPAGKPEEKNKTSKKQTMGTAQTGDTTETGKGNSKPDSKAKAKKEQKPEEKSAETSPKAKPESAEDKPQG